jgi:hypothetical protein
MLMLDTDATVQSSQLSNPEGNPLGTIQFSARLWLAAQTLPKRHRTAAGRLRSPVRATPWVSMPAAPQQYASAVRRETHAHLDDGKCGTPTTASCNETHTVKCRAQSFGAVSEISMSGRRPLLVRSPCSTCQPDGTSMEATGGGRAAGANNCTCAGKGGGLSSNIKPTVTSGQSPSFANVNLIGVANKGQDVRCSSSYTRFTS